MHGKFFLNDFFLVCFSPLCFGLTTPSLSVCFLDISNLTLNFLWSFPFFPYTSLFFCFLSPLLTIIIWLRSLLPPYHHFFPPLLPLSSVIRYPPTCPRRILGTRVGAAQRRLLGQAASLGATVWVVQPSQHAASRQRPGFYRVWHQVHRSGQPRGLLGRLPEWRSAGGPQGSLHQWHPEDGSRDWGHPLADQRGPGRLRGRPKATESLWQQEKNTLI